MKLERIKETIKHFEKMLENYKVELNKDPDSNFYQGAVKNTQEYINELKNELQE